MAIDFPNSPSNGQTFNVGNMTWEYSDGKWVIVSSVVDTLDELTDTSFSTKQTNDFLKWNGSAWINDPINLGTDTTGNYVSDITAGTGVTVSHTPGEGSSASIAIGQDVGTSASVTFARLTVSGDLTVSGTTTTLNTENLLVEDNIVLLNSGATGSPTLNAGIEIERGSSDNVQLRWNESTDSWEITENGTTYKNIAVGQDVETSASVTFAHVTANVTGDLTGTADTALALETARAISLSGFVSGSVSFDGTSNVDIPTSIDITLKDLSDSGVDGPLTGDILQYDGSLWINVPSASVGATTLDGLSDVSASAPGTGDYLQWNGSSWVPAQASTDVMADTKNAAIITMMVGI